MRGVLKRYREPAAARQELRREIAREQNPVVRIGGALWAAYLDDPALSLEILQELWSEVRGVNVGFQLWRPVMANVRKLPEFRDLVRKIGLVGYWREFGWGELCKPVGATDFQCH
jgi:hypothetical protein